MAEKLGLDAYGATSEAPDPVANASNSLMDQVHKMDAKRESMCDSMKLLDAEYSDGQLPDLENCSINPSDQPSDTPADEAKHTE